MLKMPSGYGMVQRKAMQLKISIQAKALYALLCSYTGDHEFCWPSQETLSEDLSTSKRTISRLLNELEKNNLIKREKMFTDIRSNVKYGIFFAE